LVGLADKKTQEDIPMTRITWIAAGLLSLFAAGFLLGTHYSGAQPQHTASAWSPGRGIIYCDKAHKVPFIDAAHCGGMTSCDRMFLSMGEPVSCQNKPRHYVVEPDFIPGTGGIVRRIEPTE
jgi:hypothetical protein